MQPNKNAELLHAPGALPVPQDQKVSSVAVWCDPAIWGLVIFDDQTPWFALIECLQLLTHRHREGMELFLGPVFSGGQPAHETLTYRVRLNKNLRHLLFRDQKVTRIASQPGLDSATRWKLWTDTTEKDFPTFPAKLTRDAFGSDFMQFAESIELLRSAVVEPFHAKRWTSRHLLPVGDAMLFPDVDQQDFSLDRRFFQRTGEILYLMLNRSSGRVELQALIASRLLRSDAPWNRIAQRLQGSDADKSTAQTVEAPGIGYLPMLHLSRYDLLADDWIAVLQQKAIPAEDCLEYLMRLSGLHMVLYIAERAADVACRELAPLVLDMSGSGRDNPIQTLSSERYRAHKALTQVAVEALVNSFASQPEWAGLKDTPMDKETAADLLSKRFLWTPRKTSNPLSHPSPPEQLEEMVTKAKTRNHSIGSAFTSHARKIGLLTAQQRAGTWYAPSDALLEALVLANVPQAMELDDFLALLLRRYRFVVGPQQAGTASGELPLARDLLKANERKLEERLRVLGFIDRKSDDCAFVVNPFAHGAATAPASKELSDAHAL